MRRDRDRSRSERRRGFTIIEMMVALTIGALVIASVYTIGGASARHFQEQARVSQLQLATRLAIDRIRRDVERAGLHGSPDTNLDRLGSTPPRRVVAVSVVDADPDGEAAIAAHDGWTTGSTQTDRLVLTGNFVTSDVYLVRGLNDAGNIAYLQTGWQGFRRTFVAPNGTAVDPDLFSEVFAAGRMLHVMSLHGFHYFVTVQSATIAGAGSTQTATVQFTPAIPIGGVSGGTSGLGTGMLLAPISEVQYRLVEDPSDLPGSNDPEVTGPYTALVREELDMASGAVLDTRTVLEWAVHFDVDAMVETAAAGATSLPIRVDDAAAAAALAANPQRVRSLHIEIAARTPEQDPRFPWVDPASDPTAPPLGRFRVFAARDGAARVRSASAEITLMNLVYRGLR